MKHFDTIGDVHGHSAYAVSRTEANVFIQALSSTNPKSPSVASVTSVRCFLRLTQFLARKPMRSSKPFLSTNPKSPLWPPCPLCDAFSAYAVSRTEANVFIQALSSTNPESPSVAYSTEKTPNDIGSISKYPSWNTAPCTSSGRTREDFITSPKGAVQARSAGLIATMMRSVPAIRR
jgi:hypothetical protein